MLNNNNLKQTNDRFYSNLVRCKSHNRHLMMFGIDDLFDKQWTGVAITAIYIHRRQNGLVSLFS